MNIKSLTILADNISKAYSKHHGIQRDQDWFVFKLQEELGEFTQAYLQYSKRSRSKGKTEVDIKESIEGEPADVFGHVLLLAKNLGIDHEEAMKKKWFVWLDTYKLKRTRS